MSNKTGDLVRECIKPVPEITEFVSNMPNILSPLMALLSLVGGNAAQQFEGCDYKQELIPGKPYYIFNPDYPQDYKPGASCRWVAKSDRPIKLTCDPFTIPPSEKCSQNAVVIQDATDSIGHRYCGNGTLDLVSQSNQLTITFTSSRKSNENGRFLCTLEAVSSDVGSNCRCGWKNPTRIVGGVNTGVNEYPMMAGLVDFEQGIIFCGATIINEKQVLTAAHCVNSRNIRNFGVLVGEHDTSTGAETNATKLLRVESYRIHPEYSASSDTQDYDIALVNVRGTIPFSQQVGPVCLPFQHHPDTFAGNYVDVLGWGTTEFAGSMSKILQKTRLSIITNSQCKRAYSSITTRQMCTYAEGKDSCQFDSGGPVLWQNPTTRRIVEIGLISLGGACADGDPASNTRIGAFVDWVLANTPQGIEYCKLE